MNSDTNAIVSIKSDKPVFDSAANHDVNLCATLQYAETGYSLCTQLSSLTDKRAPNITYPFQSVIASLFLTHMAQYASLNEMFGPAPEEGLDHLASPLENCCMKLVTGRSGTVKQTPSRSVADNALANIDVDELRGILASQIQYAVESGVIREGAVDGYTVAALDGLQIFSSEAKQCEEYCQVKNHRNGHEEHSHKIVVLSLCLACGNLAVEFEMLGGADPTSKAEGEQTGSKRILVRVIETHPGLIQIVVADGLYPNAPFLNLSFEYDLPFAVRIKDMRRTAVKECRERFDHGGGKSVSFIGENQKGERFLIIAHYADDYELAGVVKPVRIIQFCEIPLDKDGNADLTLHPRTKEPVNTTEAWMVVTSDDVPITTVWKVMHLRWRIENNCFHQLKTYYHLGHLFSHKGAAATVALTLLAYNARELYELRYTLYNSKGHLCTKIALTAKFRRDLSRRRIWHLFKRNVSRPQPRIDA